MLDQDESHADLGGKHGEHSTEGLKAAGRGADRDHREVGFDRRDYALSSCA